MAKVIIVDDSRFIRRRLIEMISGEGYEIMEAGDGAAGLEVVRENPDAKVVITDFNMPQMDGAQMCERIRADVPDFDGALVMVTTENDSELKSRGKAAGVRYWLTKPVDKEKLVKIIGKFAA